ncbi:hypothetical protein LguiA_025753 [Lonicera macranthoides]
MGYTSTHVSFSIGRFCQVSYWYRLDSGEFLYFLLLPRLDLVEEDVKTCGIKTHEQKSQEPAA